MENPEKIKDIMERLKDVRDTRNVFNNNYQELIDAVDILESNFELYLPANKRFKINQQRKISILLHNYLSSLFSLHSHRCRLFKKLDNDIKSYFVDEAKNNSIRHEFLKGLRTYTQHKKLPNHGTVVKISCSSTATFSGLVTYKSTLLNSYDRWEPQAKEFITQLDEEINLKNIIQDYQKETNIIYDKLNKKIIESYFGKEK